MDDNYNKLDEIIKKADESLYISKNNGKNKVTLNDELNMCVLK